jgi:NAD(P)-dependent dehydrogenase (short-subunit alcohol dehydrogenase family)
VQSKVILAAAGVLFGIGRALVQKLIEVGASVVAAARNKQVMDEYEPHMLKADELQHSCEVRAEAATYSILSFPDCKVEYAIHERCRDQQAAPFG